MRLVAYLRVSTLAQLDGAGLDIQRSAIKKWAAVNRHKIVRWCADEGISGTKAAVTSDSELDGRPALGDALALVADRTAEGIVVYRLDRLARDLVLQETVLADIRRHDGRLFSVAAGEDAYLADDPKDPSRKLIRQVLGAVSEYERSVIKLRLQTGRQRKAEQGRHGGGRPPVGFVAVGKELVPDPTEQEALELIRSMKADGASVRTICRALEAQGIKTKRGGTTWQPSVVAAIIRRTEETAA